MTYFKLDSEEATHCDHCHLICWVYIKGHVEMVDTKDQSNAIVYCVCYVVCGHSWHTQRKLLGWLLKKVMGRNALEILIPSVNIYSIWWYGWKAHKLFADWKSVEYLESYREKCVEVFCIDIVNIHSIECIRDPCLVLTVSTYIVFDGTVEKPSVSAFQNFLRIENWLNIKKVIGRNV